MNIFKLIVFIILHLVYLSINLDLSNVLRFECFVLVLI